LKRVVITGIGAISPLGDSISSLITNIELGKCGIKAIPEWDEIGGMNSKVAAPAILKDEKTISRTSRRSMGRSSIMAAQASKEAIEDAGLAENILSSGKTGCVIGSTIGSPSSIMDAFDIFKSDNSLNKMPSTQFFKFMSHSEAMNVSQYLKINGIVMSTSAACASALQAIGTAADLIRIGRQDVVLCGGCEEYGPFVTGSFDILFATSSKYNDNPTKSSRPFDRDRDGLVCGEGSGILVLEEYEHAVNRGAKIYGEVLGYNTCASGAHISQSNNDAMIRCFNGCLKEAGIAPDKIDHICAHATATIHGDIEEAKAINKVFGCNIPVNSLKGYIGHTLGASAAIELAVTLHSVKSGVIYPTLNLENVDEKCNSIMHVQQPLEKKINCIMKNSFAFGGINATIIVSKL
jgi:3-oxoacyl-[acyl-carrier-protein] synthase II